MENKLNKHTPTHMSNSHPPAALAMHKNSQAISKTKPKIRIIQLIAPEIIKTDIENFRELVQRITGKPSGEKYSMKKPIISSATAGIDQESRRGKSSSCCGVSNDKPKIMNQKWDLRNGGQDQYSKERALGFCCDESSDSSRYLGEFSELEGFISEVGEFALLPLDGTQALGFEYSQLL